MQRGARFTDEEREALLEIVEKYNDILQSKQTNAAAVEQKNEAWEKVTAEYNSTAGLRIRTIKQLTICLKNWKKRERDVAGGSSSDTSYQKPNRNKRRSSAAQRIKRKAQIQQQQLSNYHKLEEAITKQSQNDERPFDYPRALLKIEPSDTQSSSSSKESEIHNKEMRSRQNNASIEIHNVTGNSALYAAIADVNTFPYHPEGLPETLQTETSHNLRNVLTNGSRKISYDAVSHQTVHNRAANSNQRPQIKHPAAGQQMMLRHQESELDMQREELDMRRAEHRIKMQIYEKLLQKLNDNKPFNLNVRGNGPEFQI